MQTDDFKNYDLEIIIKNDSGKSLPAEIHHI